MKTIKELKDKYYIKGSKDKYQLKLKELYKKSKKNEQINKNKIEKLNKKLRKHYGKKKGEEKVEKKTEEKASEKVAEKVAETTAENLDLTERGQKRGDVTILLFYAYVRPVWTNEEQDAAIEFTYNSLSKHGCTGRLRVAREGFNAVLTGTHDGIRGFTSDLKSYQPHNFGNTDFKYVDRQPDNHMLRELKVWPVSELVTYGFNASDAPLEAGGTHLTP